MSHQFLHRWEVHTHHNQTARKSVLRVIEREIFESGPTHSQFVC